MVAEANPADRPGTLMRRPAMAAAYGSAQIITDDNLGDEYGFVLSNNLFLRKLFRP